ncbi:MAG: ion channel [Pseudomonadota bacterium]
MPIWSRILRQAYISVANLSWLSLVVATLAHALVSWVLLALAGETDLTGNTITYAYYYMTTATTVGYGDLSPTTAWGRFWALTLVLPGSIALFTAVLGKAIADISFFWRRRMNGLGSYADREDHTIILGWQPTRTARLISLVQADDDGDEKLVLVAKTLEQNPMPETLDYVRADTLSTPEALVRAGVRGAARIIVRGSDDDETLAATLAASSLADGAHIVAHFEDERAAELIARQCPDVEAIGSLTAELLVRAARDPGASRLADRLLSSDTADTAYAMTVPAGIEPVRYGDALAGLKRHYDMTLVGLAAGGSRDVDLNCAIDAVISGGDVVYYIADKRTFAGAVLWHGLKLDTLPAAPDAAAGVDVSVD